MKRVKMLMVIALVLVLPGCSGSSGVGLRPDPLPARVRTECAGPERLLSDGGKVRNDEITIARLGEALIFCEWARGQAVSAYDELKNILNAGAS